MFDKDAVKEVLSKTTNLKDYVLHKMSQLPDSDNDVFIIKLRFCKI